jgi:hypothetical protein
MTPHAPQFVGSFERCTHAPPQSSNADGHPAVMHAPAAQLEPGPHELPHAPQFARSLERSTQLPLQTLSPTAH